MYAQQFSSVSVNLPPDARACTCSLVGKHPWLWVAGFGLTSSSSPPFPLYLLVFLHVLPITTLVSLLLAMELCLFFSCPQPLTGFAPCTCLLVLSSHSGFVCFYFSGGSLNSSFTFLPSILIPTHHQYQNEPWKVQEGIAKRPWQVQIIMFPSTPGIFRKKKKEIKSLSLPLFFLIRKLSSWGLRGSLYLATPLKPEDCSVTRRTRRKIPFRVSLKVTLLFSPEGPSALAPTLRAWQGRMPCRSSYLFIINIRKRSSSGRMS